MEQMAFKSKWRACIKGCLTSGKASILVNGLATIKFTFKRGVRQGEPMAPFLFILAMDGFSVTMRSVCERHFFKESASQMMVLSYCTLCTQMTLHSLVIGLT